MQLNESQSNGEIVTTEISGIDAISNCRNALKRAVTVIDIDRLASIQLSGQKYVDPRQLGRVYLVMFPDPLTTESQLGNLTRGYPLVYPHSLYGLASEIFSSKRAEN